MKNVFSMILALGLVSSSFGQASFVNFEETDILIDGVNVHVGASQLKGDLDEIRKQWIAFVKEEIGEKMKDEDGTLVLKETVINRVTDKRGDLLTYIYNNKGRVSLNVSYRLGYDVYLNSNQYPEEFEKLESFLRHFIYVYYSEELPDLIKSNKKELKAFSKEEKKANKALKKAEKALKKDEKTIKKSNKSIKKLNKSRSKTTKDDEGFSSTLAKLDVKEAQLKDKIVKAQSDIIIQQGILSSQRIVLQKLVPKINNKKLEISTLELGLSEIKTKLKAYESR